MPWSTSAPSERERAPGAGPVSGDASCGPSRVEPPPRVLDPDAPVNTLLLSTSATSTSAAAVLSFRTRPSRHTGDNDPQRNAIERDALAVAVAQLRDLGPAQRARNRARSLRCSAIATR